MKSISKSTSRRRLVSFTRASAMCATLLAGLGLNAAFADSLDESLHSDRPIAIASYPPYMLLKSDGTASGIGPDIDRAILEALGKKNITAQVMDYGAMIPSVQTKKVLFGSGGALNITAQRCQAVLFSDPTICSGTAFLVKNAVAEQVKSFEDIARLGYKVGVCGGCVEEKYAVSAGVARENIVVIPDVVSGLNMLSDQRLDAIASTDADLADAKQKSAQGAEITLVSVSSIPRNCTGAAFNKDDAALRDAYNEGLKKIRASGAYKKILSSYNQEVMGDGTDTMTTAKLCARK